MKHQAEFKENLYRTVRKQEVAINILIFTNVITLSVAIVLGWWAKTSFIGG